MKLSIASAMIQIFMLIIMAITRYYPLDHILMLATFPILSIGGIFLAGAGNNKLGAVLVGIGSVVFIPIGLIGIVGAKQLYDEDQEFDDTWDNDY